MNRSNTDLNCNSQRSTSSAQTHPLTAWNSCGSFGSTAPEERRADKVFDQIEDMLREMMRDHEQHRLHCRVLQWNLEEEPTKVFNAVVVVNPPTSQP